MSEASSQKAGIKVLYIFNDCGFGGAGQSLLDTLNEIRNYVTPAVIVRDDADVGDRFEMLGIRCYKIPFTTDFAPKGSVDEAQRKMEFRQSYEAVLKLVPIIKKEKIELIHINSSVSYFAAIAALMADIPYVWHIRELIDEQFGCEFLNEEFKISLYKKADKLIAISDYVKNQYYKKYSLDTVRIYDGLDIKKYKRSIGEQKTFQNVFLAAGMISPEKGQWDAVRAVEILAKKGCPDIRLIIVGAGAESYIWAMKKYIRHNKLEHNITILPFCDDLSRLREKASYAITCSQSEALGRVTIEAMLAGHFLIGARSGATTELIGAGEERGILYGLHDSEALAEAMLRAMRLPMEEKLQIAEEAQAYAESIFDAKKYCVELTDLYEEVTKLHQTKKTKDFLHELQNRYECGCDAAKRNVQSEGTQIHKLEAAWRILLKWMEIRQSGRNLEEYFKAKNIRSIAIYGMAELGRRLYDELENGDVEVKYILDRNPCGMEQIFELADLDGEKMDVDAVVVTVALAERQVAELIKDKGYQCVIGLSEVMQFFQEGCAVR